MQERTENMPVPILNDVEQEIMNFLCDLIRINTTNPPGGETASANFIAKYLAKDGFKSEIIE